MSEAHSPARIASDERESRALGKALTSRLTAAKFSRRKTWLWDTMKRDVSFPRPFYIGSIPYWIEAELDAYMAAKAAERA